MTAERSWKVITDDRETEGVEILIMANRANFTNGLPLIGDAYQTDNVLIPWLRCIGLVPEQDGDDPYFWNVRASYTSDFQSELAGNAGTTGGNTGAGGNIGTGGGMQPNPLLRPQQVSYSTRVRKKLLERDANGKAAVNAAGERFAQPLEEDEYNLVITIKRNKATFNRVQAWTYVGTVAEVAWEGYAVRAPRITNWTGDPAEESNVFYYVETIEIEVQWPNWDIEALNEGTYSFSDDGTHTKEDIDMLANHGIPQNGKILLDALGHALPRTNIPLAVLAGNRTVAPSSMFNIKATADRPLNIRSVNIVNGAAVYTEEEVIVTAVAATTFTAIFANAHAAGAIVTGVPTYETFQRRVANFTTQLGISI